MSYFAVEFEEEEEVRLEAGNIVRNMAASNSLEAVVDSGVDSEATTPSSPEDDPQEDEQGVKASKEDSEMSDEMVLETAETLLALSGKKTAGLPASLAASSAETAIVLPQQPPINGLQKGKL